jgi:predicted nucleic acid-binding protein
MVAASRYEELRGLWFCDALIVVAAQRSGAERLVSEDLQPGRTNGGIRMENPFT